MGEQLSRDYDGVHFLKAFEGFDEREEDSDFRGRTESCDVLTSL